MHRGLLISVLAIAVLCLFDFVFGRDPQEKSPPAAWGSDHVGKGFPDFMTGDECLFCHRRIGSSWSDNPHQRTVRRAEPGDSFVEALVKHFGDENERFREVDYVMGAEHIVRFLRRSDQYGRLDLLPTAWIPQHSQQTVDGGFQHADSLTWDPHTFADRCAGCHATAVETSSQSFSAISLDCFVCHGAVDRKHTSNTDLVLLSKESVQPQEVVSICSQCHLRGGRSRSSGRPYPNTFVPGDNLFLDFQVDLSDAAIDSLPDPKRHILLNARDVAEVGDLTIDCTSCHSVHGNQTDRHRLLDRSQICASCHVDSGRDFELRREYMDARDQRETSATCDY